MSMPVSLHLVFYLRIVSVWYFRLPLVLQHAQSRFERRSTTLLQGLLQCHSSTGTPPLLLPIYPSLLSNSRKRLIRIFFGTHYCAVMTLFFSGACMKNWRKRVALVHEVYAAVHGPYTDYIQNMGSPSTNMFPEPPARLSPASGSATKR